jgi:hypothetical protein
MKNILIFLVLIILCIHCAAQTVLPYYTGFDNATQKAGWQQFRKGYTGSYNWTYNNFIYHSSPTCLYHDYPLGSSGTDTTVDWFVSPLFNFSSGGIIDSLKINVWSITGSNTPVDEISLYLLTGSNNPSVAGSVIPLASLKNMVSSANVYRDTGNFTIPSTTGNCYIGIKYKATNNWFVISIDDIYISGNYSGIDYLNNDNNIDFLYPNPCKDRMSLILPGYSSKWIELSFFNSLGIKVDSRRFKNFNEKALVNISELNDGLYFVEITGNNGLISREKLIILK